MKKSRFWIQLLVGFGLIGYAIHSEMIDWQLLVDLVSNPKSLAVNFIFLGLIMLLLTQRWHRWTQTFNLDFTYRRLLHIGMASAFLCTFLPSSVGNDLAKIGLGIGDKPQKKSQVLFTVFLDRLIGLYAMLIFPGLALLLFHSNSAVLFGSLLKVGSVALLFAPLAFYTLPLSAFLRRHRFYKSQELADALDYFKTHRRTVAGVLLVTLVVTTLNILQYQVQAALMGLDLPVTEAFWLVPIGLLACALPFLPLGIGIGQVTFFHLFQTLGWDGSQGATLVTAIQGYSILFNLTGLIAYLSHQPTRAASVSTKTV